MPANTKNIPAYTSSHYSLLKLVLQHKQNSQDWRKSSTSPGVRQKIRHGKPIYARLQKHWHKLTTETLLFKLGQSNTDDIESHSNSTYH